MADPAAVSELSQIIALATGGSGIGISSVAAYVVAKKVGWINGADYATLEHQTQIMKLIAQGHEDQKQVLTKTADRSEQTLAVLEEISRNIAILVDRGHR